MQQTLQHSLKLHNSVQWKAYILATGTFPSMAGLSKGPCHQTRNKGEKQMLPATVLQPELALQAMTQPYKCAVLFLSSVTTLCRSTACPTKT